MKYITLIIGLLVVGCGKQEQTDANKSTPTTNTNEVSGTTEKPVKELTLEEKVVGTYVSRHNEKEIFFENGMVWLYNSSDEKIYELPWEIVGEEVHVKFETEGRGADTAVYIIELTGDLALIASIGPNGKRIDADKEAIFRGECTYKKIK